MKNSTAAISGLSSSILTGLIYASTKDAYLAGAAFLFCVLIWASVKEIVEAINKNR